MKRAHLVVLASLVVGTGCAGIIGVPDLSYDPAADAGGTSPGPGGGDATTPPLPEPNACGARLSEDPRNCGRCEHSCGAGGCKDGRCESYVLAQGVNSLEQLSIDKDYVYFVGGTQGTINRVKKDKSEAPVALVTGVNSAIGVVSDGTTMSYTSRDGLYQCDITGGTCMPGAPKNAYSYGHYISLLGNSLLVATQDNVYRRVGDVETVIAGTGNTNNFVPAQSAKYAYFTIYNTGFPVARAPLDGTGPTSPESFVPADSAYYPFLISFDGDRLFYAYESDGTGQGIVGSAAEANAADKITYTSSGKTPIGVAADAIRVYWTERGDVEEGSGAPRGNGRLLTCPRGGCPPEGPQVLVDNLVGGGLVALDDTFVFFGEDASHGPDGKVRAVAKP